MYNIAKILLMIVNDDHSPSFNFDEKLGIDIIWQLYKNKP